MTKSSVPEFTTRSYWLGHAPYSPSPPLGGDLNVDVAIVGGGFTGLWTAIALRLAEPSCRWSEEPFVTWCFAPSWERCSAPTTPAAPSRCLSAS